ncbi:MAG: peptidase T [Pirellulales bacterium]|nr:peptidase T [Pirellulales bacterium]
MLNSQRLLARFLRYVQVDSTAREDAPCYPSSPGQLELGRMLVEELSAIGLADVEQNEHGIVMATVPPTVKHAAPTIALNSHVDTSPETTGKNVQPQIVRNYAGGDIPLPADASRVIRVENNPELKNLIGKTIITTDGTTLLGADDKAGIAVIMELATHLMEDPSILHGPVRVLFTCDEEVGHGVDHVDLKKLGATVCYTLDGFGAGEIDIETFSADLAIVTVRGVNIHPSIGKGRLVNAVRVAADFVARLPRERMSPETTAGREGFLHPYVVNGGVAETTLRILLRDFDTPKLKDHADHLRQAAVASMAAFPGSSIEVKIVEQYRNLAEGLATEPRAVELAKRAVAKTGYAPKLTIIRGGTDGSRFTELGLPTPNLSTGEHNPHSPLEWTCLEEMEQAVRTLIELVQLWGAENEK